MPNEKLHRCTDPSCCWRWREHTPPERRRCPIHDPHPTPPAYVSRTDRANQALGGES
ncbi:hypothetical protein FHU29_003452 [Hoyosella altamirensis]|uniref:Uncharacterized protein n=1 Tax=Hoyosella altamirensis TaxID=616997 RepID=A0A839RST9_9ACTN|nr:hypothetical protein [Hoyosella altamirensis]